MFLHPHEDSHLGSAGLCDSALTWLSWPKCPSYPDFLHQDDTLSRLERPASGWSGGIHNSLLVSCGHTPNTTGRRFLPSSELFLDKCGKALECFSLHPPFPYPKSGFLAPGRISIEPLPGACRGAATPGLTPAGAECTPRARCSPRPHRNTDQRGCELNWPYSVISK